ncbi:hypothetical protein D769_04329 [Cupriavidus sp. HMR-1]|uniref:hypothetical protein n=1 Tax=Cupriavidus sp. HMR-1 TaxID=1249621 RepID=UPI0002A3EEC0|nr:hypothetical protein [Cupriavidus sp. HMR-1]ELA00626.1 hypothetical protein D769_04329 [Cupriavidus sp. HMR-1]
MNAADVKFVEAMVQASAEGLAQGMGEQLRAQADRIQQLEQQVALMQNALAQSGQKFVLPAGEHQPLSFTTTRRRA